MKSTVRVFQLAQNGAKTVPKRVRNRTKTLFQNRQKSQETVATVFGP